MTPSAQTAPRPSVRAAKHGRMRRVCIFPGVETKQDIITRLASGRTVERLVENITRRPLDPTTEDLAQMVYLYLLEFPEDKLLDLWTCRQLDFFIVRVIINQWAGSRSSFKAALRTFSQRSQPIDTLADKI